MENRINEIIDKNFDEMLSKLAQIIKIKSVSGKARPGMPYGEECARVLKRFLEMAYEYGFYVKNYENYVGTIGFNETPVKLGILCHLDVVPATASDWTHDPFDCVIKNGRVYGRGAIDDKGPAMAVLFAMKAIKEAGIKLKHNVRFIVGCDEENGSTDLEYYLKKEKMPPMVFTPDGDYPVINIEKGMLRLSISRKIKMSHIMLIKGGTVPNAVPSDAYAIIKYTGTLPKNEKISVSRENDVICVSYKGTAAHASTPETGDNAVTGLISYLCSLSLDEEELHILNVLKNAFIHGDFTGKGTGINMSDERSGALTNVLSIINYDGENFELKTDVRYPLCGEMNEIKQKISDAVSAAGFELTADIENKPHCVDEDSDFIKTLLKVYHEQTGLEPCCKAIGGGTYVHDIEGGVAFGAEFPGDQNNMHGNDESITLDSLRLNTKIIAHAIYEICRE